MNNFITTTITFIGVLILAALLLSLPTLLLWNWLVPEILGLPPINFWQAIGINLLCGVLFRSSNTTKDAKS